MTEQMFMRYTVNTYINTISTMHHPSTFWPFQRWMMKTCYQETCLMWS